jgi:hypothetical protein
MLIVFFSEGRVNGGGVAAGSVCWSCRRVAKEETDLRRRIDLSNHGHGCDAFLSPVSL